MYQDLQGVSDGNVEMALATVAISTELLLQSVQNLMIIDAMMYWWNRLTSYYLSFSKRRWRQH